MEIALRVVQFWSEIKLVITNRTPASRSCDFVITRLISDQIALHSVQLPLLITHSATGRIKALLVVLNLLFNISCASDSNHSVSQCLYKPSDKFVHVLITILY